MALFSSKEQSAFQLACSKFWFWMVERSHHLRFNKIYIDLYLFLRDRRNLWLKLPRNESAIQRFRFLNLLPRTKYSYLSESYRLGIILSLKLVWNISLFDHRKILFILKCILKSFLCKNRLTGEANTLLVLTWKFGLVIIFDWWTLWVKGNRNRTRKSSWW